VKTRLPAFFAITLALVLAGCVTPALDRGAYLQNAKSALESGMSETRTAQLAAEARLAGNATRAFADTLITDSEGALGPIQQSFGGVDPASRADDELRTRVLEVLGEAEDALAMARIAVRRDDAKGLHEAVGELHRVSENLERVRTALE
jgi:hypothetical protein